MKKINRSIHQQIFFISFMVVLFASLTSVSSQPMFTDVSEEAGVDHFFRVFQGTFGGGAAVIDYNMDGWEDVYLTGGANEDQLLENQGDGTFVNVAGKVGLRPYTDIVTQGVAVADVNKDGWPDLFISTIAEITDISFKDAANILFINNQDGTFTNQAEAYGLVEKSFASSAAFGDVNRDGYPDLYVCNYFDGFGGDLDQFGGPIAGGNFKPGVDHFYLNDGGGRFIESSEAYGIIRKGLTFQGLWTDFDNDRDLDLLIANDFGNRGTPNLLYRNDFPKASFTEIGADMNFDYGINGMGIGAIDVNLDGLLDYYVTNIQASPLFVNQGPETPFTDESLQRGAGFFTVKLDGGGRITPVSWGVNCFDFDHDMDTDLYITNGCLNPQLAPHPNLFLDNVGGEFRESGARSNTNDHSIGRGSIVFDYDRDGDLDLLVVNQSPFRNINLGIDFKGTRLYRNDTPDQGNWLKVKLKGIASESQGMGSRIEAYVEGQILVREVYGGSSHASQNTMIAHFGTASYPIVDSLIIKWAAGGTQKMENVGTNQTIEIEENLESPFSNAQFHVYPNLFSEEVTFNFELSEFSSYTLKVYDLKGREVESLINHGEGFSGGKVWQVPSNITPGMYLFVLQTSRGYYVKKGIKK